MGLTTACPSSHCIIIVPETPYLLSLTICQIFCHLFVLHFILFYGIITCTDRKWADSQRNATYGTMVDSWCKFDKHGNLLFIDCVIMLHRLLAHAHLINMSSLQHGWLHACINLKQKSLVLYLTQNTHKNYINSCRWKYILETLILAWKWLEIDTKILNGVFDEVTLVGYSANSRPYNLRLSSTVV